MGSAITGARTRPPTTLGSAPSMPATTIMTLALLSSFIRFESLCRPATPTSVIRLTSQPISVAVRTASLAIGKSEVPAATTATPGIRSFFSRRSAQIACAPSSQIALGTVWHSNLNACLEDFVTNTTPSLAKMRSAISAVSFGVLLRPYTTSGNPIRSLR